MATLPQSRTQLPAKLPEPSAIEGLDQIASECRDLACYAQGGQFAKALTIAQAIGKLRAALTPEVMQWVMGLQGSMLGFKTDKDRDGGYAVDVVRDCLIEAVMLGAYPVNNEFNIISGRAYLAKNFFKRKLRELPELTGLKLSPGVPVVKEGGALVAYSAAWVYKGKPGRMECQQTKLPDGSIIDERIPVRVNSGMGVDAILGKAERKIRARIYEELTGTEVNDGEVEDVTARATITNAAPANGRVSFRQTATEGQQPTEPAHQPKPVPEDLEAADLAAEVRSAIGAATSPAELTEMAGVLMTRHRERISEATYGALEREYEARNRELTKGKEAKR